MKAKVFVLGFLSLFLGEPEAAEKSRSVRSPFQGLYEGVLRSKCSRSIQDEPYRFLITSKGALLGVPARFMEEPRGMITASVPPTGVILGRTSEGIIFKGRVQNGVLLGAVGGPCGGPVIATITRSNR